LHNGKALENKMGNKYHTQGRIQDFKLGGEALKKIVPSGGRRENIWGFSCEKFYAKKHIFSNLGGGGRQVIPSWIRP
jgi:hypothetical protein